jgi:hypothetical protein
LKPKTAQPVPPAAEEGVATTQRIIQPPAYRTILHRHRVLALAAAMGLMFFVGWMVRAWIG